MIEIEEGYHPLLTTPVANSITLRGRSALVTGSNMTGKTTLRCVERGDSPVLAVDEPFSGTNTVERIAAAKAVLAALARRSQVLASTHDSELQVLLAETFDSFHFTEDPGVEGFFDYRLRSGGSTEGNALRLLGAIGFPPPVVADALATAAELGRNQLMAKN